MRRAMTFEDVLKILFGGGIGGGLIAAIVTWLRYLGENRNNAIAGMRTVNQALSEMNARLEQKIDEMEVQIRALEDQVKAQAERITTREQELTAILARRQEDHQREIDRLNGLLRNRTERIVELEAEVKQLKRNGTANHEG